MKNFGLTSLLIFACSIGVSCKQSKHFRISSILSQKYTYVYLYFTSIFLTINIIRSEFNFALFHNFSDSSYSNNC